MFSDELEDVTYKHRNAKMLQPPSRVSPAVTMSLLTPLNWGAVNGQHCIHNDVIDASSYPEYQAYIQGRYDPNFVTWNMFLDNIR